MKAFRQRVAVNVKNTHRPYPPMSRPLAAAAPWPYMDFGRRRSRDGQAARYGDGGTWGVRC